MVTAYTLKIGITHRFKKEVNRVIGNTTMESFEICKETAIVIYGLGNIGKRKCRELVNMGYQVIGIIDQNAETLSSYCGIDVYTAEKFAKIFAERNEIVIVICLNNGLQHEKTAYALSEYGYKKLLYIPMDADADYEYLMNMQKSYSLFLDGRFSELKEIPMFVGMKGDSPDNIQVISQDSENVVFLCDIEYLFSQDMSILKKDVEYIYKKRLKDNRYVDKPVASVQIYKDLYDFLMGKSQSPDIYLQHQGKEMGYNRKLLFDRAELFENYEKRYNRNIKLFYMQPTTVIWNEKKGYFNVIDGMHRLMYLYYVKNHFKVPVKTSRESFNMFKCNYKSKEYLYKSVTLIFQELLLPQHFVGNGAVISEKALDLNQKLINTGGGI